MPSGLRTSLYNLVQIHESEFLQTFNMQLGLVCRLSLALKLLQVQKRCSSRKAPCSCGVWRDNPMGKARLEPQCHRRAKVIGIGAPSDQWFVGRCLRCEDGLKAMDSWPRSCSTEIALAYL